MKYFTEDELSFVKKQLKNKTPKTKVAAILHTDSRTFNRMCKDAGFNYPSFGRKKLTTNPFENVNNPDVQYWLGWLATDGYVCNKAKNYRCALLVSEKDIDILEKFNEFLGGNLIIHKTIHHKKFPMVSISFKNQDIIDYLVTLGFSRNKTFDFDPKFEISWDYIRGCFEGDGYYRKKKYEISMVSASFKHINKIKDFIEKYDIKTHLYHRKTKTQSDFWTLSILKKSDVEKIIGYLYESAHYFLNRKYDLARNIRNNIWKSLKVGEPVEGIPSEAPKKENV